MAPGPITVERTAEFDGWLDGLRDDRAFARISARVRRLALGNPGKIRGVGSGVIEMKIDYGPGYRVYYLPRGPRVVLVLGGGDKSTQQRDIERVIEIAENLE